MSEGNWSSWQEMCGELVTNSGGIDEITSRFCRIVGRSSVANFETTKRNVANWLNGAAIPQRKNFQILTQALKIERDPALLARWRTLYAAARENRAVAHMDVPADDAPMKAPSRFSRPLLLKGLAFAAVVLAASSAAYALFPSDANKGRVIGYLSYAKLKVGESVLIHAKRGECGEAPPEWHEIEHEIPKLETGRLVDDGLGMSQSVTCGGLTPGRLVRFEAQAPGEEVFNLFQRSIKVVVLPAD